MRKALLLFCILVNTLFAKAQEISFSDSTTISLITCSPGPEVYAKFGHSAIRINDHLNGFDYVFNYGIFSFDTNNFYLKFIKGETDYMLGVYETSFFLPEYKARNSQVTEQILNLTKVEKRRLINYLLVNYEPQNRTYRYNFVFDNCATRPRDRILGALQGFTRFNSASESKTFRQWVGYYVGTDTWLKFGIDLIFGIDADKVATVSESMFLPEVLMSEFQTAQLTDHFNKTRKLVSSQKVIIQKNEITPKETATSKFLKPLNVAIFLLVMGILLTLWDIYRKRHTKWFDSALFIITGLTGIVIYFLMFFSTHPLVKSNLNLLWLNPLNILFGIAMWIKITEVRRFIFFYQTLNIALYVSALFAFALSVQSLNSACFPLIVLLLMRSTSWFAYTKHKLYKRRSLK